MMRGWLLTMLLLATSGCREITEDYSSMKSFYRDETAKSVAVLPFVNLSANPSAGNDMSLFCYNELFRLIHEEKMGIAGRVNFSVVDEHLVSSGLSENKWDDAEALKKVALSQVCEALKCQLLLVGTVSEYHYKRGLGEDPVVGLHLRMYDAESDTIMWAGSLARVGRFSWFKEAPWVASVNRYPASC